MVVVWCCLVLCCLVLCCLVLWRGWVLDVCVLCYLPQILTLIHTSPSTIHHPPPPSPPAPARPHLHPRAAALMRSSRDQRACIPSADTISPSARRNDCTSAIYTSQRASAQRACACTNPDAWMRWESVLDCAGGGGDLRSELATVCGRGLWEVRYGGGWWWLVLWTGVVSVGRRGRES